MKNCSTLQELKAYLEEDTDYGQFFQENMKDSITTVTLKNILREKMAGELKFLERNQISDGNRFMNYLKCPYMIDNVVNIIEGIKNKVDTAQLEANIHPLGWFPEIANVKVTEDDFSTLYESVLVETPISDYFLKFLEISTNKLTNLTDIQAFFKETSPETIRNCLKRLWIEDFLEFSEKLNGITADNMTDILKTRADYMAIQAVYSTLNLSKNARETTRNQLLPSCGYLYPDCFKALKECDSFENLKAICVGVHEYQDILNRIQDPTKLDDFRENSETIDDLIFFENVKKTQISL